MKHRARLIFLVLAGLFTLLLDAGVASAATVTPTIHTGITGTHVPASVALAAANKNQPVAVNGPSAGGAATAVQPGAMSACPTSHLCVWVNSGFGGGVPAGQPGVFMDSNRNWLDFSQPGCRSGTWNDCASSGWNRRGQAVEVWQNINFTGLSACLPNGWSNSDFANLVWPGSNVSFNDSISSDQLVGNLC